MSSRSPIQSDEFFSDIETTFARNPVSDDTMRLKNVESIKRSVRNIILTNKGERALSPGFGSGLRSFLFENDSPFNRFILKKEIEYTLRAQEPRISVTNVEIGGRIDGNALDVTIEFTPINSAQSVNLNVILERAR